MSILPRRFGVPKRSVVSVLATTLGIGLSAMALGSTSASAMSNIPEAVPYTSHCSSTPTSAQCWADGLATLNHGRAVLGQPAYSLPADFSSRSATEQLVILVNQDRALYHLPLVGLNATLNGAALNGIQTTSDPIGPSSLNGSYSQGWGSNIAMGWKSVEYAYYFWMYADGPGGYNMDCTPSYPAGCWGHRNVILKSYPSGSQVFMGAMTGINGAYHTATFTMLLDAFPAANTIPEIPTVMTMSTHSGAAAGGTRVWITGYGMKHLHSVSFGNGLARITAYAENAINAYTPAGVAGQTVPMIVHDTGGANSTATSLTNFSYAS